MDIFLLLLILFSACLHVVQHVAIKRARDRTSFVWWTWIWASMLFLPVPIFFWQSFSALAWLILIVSAVFEAVYYASMAKAYQSGDLSVVYPLARGTAPLFILLWSSVLFQERPSAGGICGLALIIAGLYVINLPRLDEWREFRRKFLQPGQGWALLAGVSISCYTTLDKAGVRMVAPLLYTYLVMTLSLVWLTPRTFRAVGRHGLVAEWQVSKFNSLIAGITAMSAYAIVLYAIQNGAPVSYVGAMREISVVLGVIVGAVFLKEHGTLPRIFGSTLIAAGVGAISLFG